MDCLRFHDNHNHELLSQLEIDTIASNRGFSDEQEQAVKLLRDAGLRVPDIHAVLSKQFDKVTWLQKDIHNLIQKMFPGDAEHDAENLLVILRDKKDIDPDFRCDFCLDDYNRLEHLFWMFGESRRPYLRFSDALIFDATNRTNRYKMPLAIFCAVNNHGQTQPIAGGLLRNETREAYRWLFKVSLKAVDGRQPGSMLTDQDHWMSQALEEAMPLTKNAFCIWHIAQKFPQHFRSAMGSAERYQKFVSAFYKVYNVEAAEDFSLHWADFLQEFNMQENQHLSQLYRFKEQIMPCFLRDHFFANMTTTQRSESINALMNKFLSNRMDLVTFITEFENCVTERSKHEVRQYSFVIFSY